MEIKHKKIRRAVLGCISKLPLYIYSIKEDPRKDAKTKKLVVVTSPP